MPTTRWLALLALSALLTPTGTASADEADWKRYESEKGLCTFEMPGEPKHDTQRIETTAGTIEVNVYQWPHDGKAYPVYSVAISELPALPPDVNADKLLDGGRVGALAHNKGKLLTEKPIKLGDLPGRELVMETPGGALFRQRAFLDLASQRMYQVAVEEQQAEPTAATTRFLESFKLKGAE